MKLSLSFICLLSIFFSFDSEAGRIVVSTGWNIYQDCNPHSSGQNDKKNDDFGNKELNDENCFESSTSDGTIQLLTLTERNICKDLTLMNDQLYLDLNMVSSFQLTKEEIIRIATQYPWKRPCLFDFNNPTAFVIGIRAFLKENQYDYRRQLASNRVEAEPLAAIRTGKPSIGLGISNDHGSCWFNATLKSLMHTIDFTELAASLEERENVDINIKNAARLIAELQAENELVKNGQKDSSYRSEVPKKLKALLHEHCRSTSIKVEDSLFPQPWNSHQQDASEFVVFLFDLFELQRRASMNLTKEKKVSVVYKQYTLNKQFQSEITSLPIIIIPKKASPESIARRVIQREAERTLPVEDLAFCDAPTSAVKEEAKLSMFSDIGLEGAKAGTSKKRANELADEAMSKPITIDDGLAATMGGETQLIKWSLDDFANNNVFVSEELELETQISPSWRVNREELKRLFIMFSLFSYQNNASGKNTQETKEMFCHGGDPIFIPVIDQEGNPCQVKGTVRSVICHSGMPDSGHYITLNVQDDGSVVVEDDMTVVKLEDYDAYCGTQGLQSFIKKSGYSPYIVCYDCEVVPVTGNQGGILQNSGEMPRSAPSLLSWLSWLSCLSE